ncbi:MAG: tyrosine--tRNA ligase [Acidobacteria bacterium]|nr:tyrosine--tRNA ligase [Acidobacteriota bacterium]
MDLLRQGAVDLVSEEELAAKIERSIDADRPLVVKVGFDPSAPDIHLGHTVVMHKMKQFQDFGHEVVFVVGDFTGMIGDPSGKSKTRPQLTPEQIQDHARTYEEQAFRILERGRSRTEFNSTWLDELGSAGLIRLASRYTVARMMERDDFKKRFESQQPIALHEFLYPLAQAYDSVALKADVEMGGTDQLFNLLVGRDIMREYGLEPQVVLTMPLLVGTDGVEKMSKSLANYIAIEDTPAEMYGKILSLSDETMWTYWELCTTRTGSELDAMRAAIADGALHPKAAKQDLARTVVARYHDEAAAVAAEAEFEKVFAARQVPTEMPDVAIESAEPVWIVTVIVKSGFSSSNGEARRFVKQGAVSLDGERISDEKATVPSDDTPRVLKVGKRRFARIRVS